MTRIILVLTYFFASAYSNCTRYTFGEDYEYLFANTKGVCTTLSSLPWSLGYYKDTDVTGQDEQSTSFITPESTLSCVASFDFTMTSDGMVEVTIYTNNTSHMDHLNILVSQVSPIGVDPIVGNGIYLAMSPGWNKLRIPLSGLGSYEGYVTFMGRVSHGSILIVDSFRFIGPNTDPSTCKLYDDDIITTTTDESTTSSLITTIKLPPTTFITTESTNIPTEEIYFTPSPILSTETYATTTDMSDTDATIEDTVTSTEVNDVRTTTIVESTTNTDVITTEVANATTVTSTTVETNEGTTVATSKPTLTTTTSSGTTITTTEATTTTRDLETMTTEVATKPTTAIDIPTTTTSSPCKSCQKSITFLFFKMQMK